MADNFGLKIGIEGEKEFKNSLRDINSSFKVLASEMKLVQAQFDKQDGGIKALSARNTVLNKEIDLQRQKIAMLSDALKNATDSFGENDKRTQNWAIQLNNAQADLIGMERELDKNNATLVEAGEGFDEAGKDADEFGDSVKVASDRLDGANKRVDEFGRHVDGAGSELDAAGDEAAEFGAEIADASGKASIFGDVLKANLVSDMIKGSIKAIGSAIKEIADAFKLAIEVGIEFDSAFAGVKKTVDATDTELAKLEQGIRDMALEIPTSASELANIAELAGQLGIETNSILGFTSTMADLAEATNLTGDEAATTFAQFANITKMDQNDFGRLGSSIVALGNNFATTEADIAHMAQNLASAGTQVGMSQADILGLSAALSSVGIEAEAGGTAFSKVMVNMQVAVENGGDSLKQFASVAGMSTSEFSEMFRNDATGAITAFIGGLADAESSGKSAIGVLDNMGISEVRLRDSLLRAANANDLFNDAIDTSNQSWEDNTALTNEANQRYETMESQLGILKNTATDFGISIYKDIQQPMMEVVKLGQTYMKQLNDAFEKNGLQGLLDEAGRVLADILTQILKYAPSIIESAVSVMRMLVAGIVAALPEITNAATQVILTLLEGMLAMLPMILDGALQIITGLALGIGQALPVLIPAAVEAIMLLCQTLVDSMPSILQAALELVTGLAQGVINSIPVLVKALPEVINSIVNFIIGSIPQIISTGIRLLTSLVTSLPTIINTIVAAIPSIINNVVSAIIKGIPQIIQSGVQLLTSLIRNLPSIISTVVAAIPQIVSGLVNAIVGNIGQIVQAGVELLVSLVKNLPAIIAGVIRAIPQIITAIVSALTGNISKISDVGVNLIKGLWNGISSVTNWLWSKISGFMGGVIDKIKGFFGIKSPSTVFADIGRNLGEGLGVGFVDSMDKVSDDMRNAIPTDFEVDASIHGRYAGQHRANEGGRYGDGGTMINQNISITSPKALSEKEAAREFRNLSRKLALGI